MFYMIIFWAIYVFILFYFLYYRLRDKRYNQNVVILSIMVAFSFLVIGVITKDPLFSAIGVLVPLPLD